MSALPIGAALPLTPFALAGDDLGRVAEIERDIYEFPWTIGNFRDSLRAGYGLWGYRVGDVFAGYAVIMMVPEEAHILNLSVARSMQRRGYGSAMLDHLYGVAAHGHALRVILEVRPSNEAARRLYARHGFERIGLRRGYYPSADGREDALVLGRRL